MGIQLNPLTGLFDIAGSGGGGGGGAVNWKETVTNFAALPAVGNTVGDVRITADTQNIYVWDGATWQLKSGGSPTFTPNRAIVSDNSGALADTNGANDVTLISNSLKRGKTSSAVVQEEYLDAITLTDNSTNANITALSFATATYAGIVLDYVIKTGAGTPALRIGTLNVVSNGTTASIADAFNETAAAGVTFSVVINGANTEIHYTTTSQGSARTLRCDVKRFRI